MVTQNDMNSLTAHSRQAQVNLEIVKCINEIAKILKAAPSDPLKVSLQDLVNAVRSQIEATSKFSDDIEIQSSSGAKSE